MATRLLRGVSAALVLLAAVPVSAQRVQFPSPVSSSAPAAGGTPAQYTAQVAPPGGWDPYAAPGSQPVTPAYTPPAYTQPPTYTPPPTYSQPPAYTPAPYNPNPAAPYTPPPGAAPYSASPSSLYPDPAAAPYYTPPSPTVQLTPSTRLLQEIRLQETWIMGGSGDGDVGINDIETSVTFAFPFPFIGNVQTSPLLITPGFALHLWDGPKDVIADMPPQTYDAFVDFAWSPEILPWLSAEVGFRSGVYSDFHTMNTQSVRFIGGGMGVVRLSPNLWAKAGAIYPDRADTKIIPAGGIVWKPSDESLWEIVFPRPKISRRLSTVGVVPVWGFVAMDFFGGGSWTIERASGASDEVEYDDMRVELGLEWETPSHWKFLFETGYVFNRKLKYVSLLPEEFDPDGSFMLRAGVAW